MEGGARPKRAVGLCGGGGHRRREGAGGCLGPRRQHPLDLASAAEPRPRRWGRRPRGRLGRGLRVPVVPEGPGGLLSPGAARVTFRARCGVVVVVGGVFVPQSAEGS